MSRSPVWCHLPCSLWGCLPRKKPTCVFLHALLRVLPPWVMQDLKLKFYRLLIQLQSNNKDSIALCRSFQAVYSTRNVDKDRAVWTEALESIIVFLALSAFDNEVSDLLHRFKADPKLDELPAYKYDDAIGVTHTDCSAATGVG